METKEQILERTRQVATILQRYRMETPQAERIAIQVKRVARLEHCVLVDGDKIEKHSSKLLKEMEHPFNKREYEKLLEKWEKNKKDTYSDWEKECDMCVELLEGQRPPLLQDRGNMRYKKVLIGDLQSRTARIARLEERRKSLRRYCLSVDTNVPALSSNTPTNSIVQAIHGREIGLKKPYTEKLYKNVYDHTLYDSPSTRFRGWVFWGKQHLTGLEPPPSSYEAIW